MWATLTGFVSLFPLAGTLKNAKFFYPDEDSRGSFILISQLIAGIVWGYTNFYFIDHLPLFLSYEGLVPGQWPIYSIGAAFVALILYYSLLPKNPAPLNPPPPDQPGGSEPPEGRTVEDARPLVLLGTLFTLSVVLITFSYCVLPKLVSHEIHRGVVVKGDTGVSAQIVIQTTEETESYRTSRNGRFIFAIPKDSLLSVEFEHHPPQKEETWYVDFTATDFPESWHSIQLRKEDPI